MSVSEAFSSVGFYLKDISLSPIKGGDGNTEFISCFIKEKPLTPISEIIRVALENEI